MDKGQKIVNKDLKNRGRGRERKILGKKVKARGRRSAERPSS